MSATLRTVNYPAIGRPAEARPGVPPEVFLARLAKVRAKMVAKGLDALVVYGDREHFGNLVYMTNYDPRFEEALLVILPTGTPVLLVGNEGWGYSQIARLPVERMLYQTLSLLGQPREQVRPLTDLLRKAGIRKGMQVGSAGWKYFSAAEFANPEKVLDLPDFMAHALRQTAGRAGRVTNETAMFMDAETGLRNILEPEQIADFEWVATHNSQNLLEGIRALRPGMTELTAFANMPYNGTPLCCHPVCATGDSLRRSGMPSPTSRAIALGDPVMMTFSYQGANVCRFGWMAHGPEDLPAEAKDYVERAAKPHFDALSAWYRTMRLGVSGDTLHHAVADRLLPLGFTLSLNCGHQIAGDEWTHSLVAAGSTQKVVSGMYWQSDFFPTLSSIHYGAFAEDGLVIADAPLRAELAARFPTMWARIQERRRFMTGVVGMEIAEEILPFANFAGAIIPFFLNPNQCLVAG